MKDLDFDEIDRAVNSVITTIPKTDDDVSVVTKPDESSTFTVNVSTPNVAPVIQSLAGRRSSGQFMDVVHPSSDMRKAPIVSPERAPIPNLAANMFTRPVAAELPSTTVTPNFDSTPSSVDFIGINTNIGQTGQTEEDDDIGKLSDDLAKELNQNDSNSPDSPFLAGTKVEKRPLGAFSDDQTAMLDDNVNQDEKINQANNDQSSFQTDTKLTLPDELQNDLLKVESDSVSMADNPVVVPEEMPDDASETTVSTNETPDEAPITQDTPEVPEKPLESSEAAINEHPTGPVSITQQYKEQPSSGEKSTGAIYDTDSYHKALVRPSNKKSGWMWVLWIAILLAVGAGVGFVVYKFVLPSL